MIPPKLPEYWSPEQALAVYDYLQMLSTQLLNHYRDDFIRLFGELPGDPVPPDPAPQQQPLFETDFEDDLPF